LAEGNLKAASDSLPTTIQGALESPRICDLELVVGKITVTLMIEYELIKLARQLNLGGNLRDEQARELAEELHKNYPKENIADFRTCFHRATFLHKYGEIFRLDMMVITGWFTQYLEEKYEALEKEVHAFKDNTYQPPTKKESDPNFNLVEEFKKIHGDVADKIPKMLPGMISFHGQEAPPDRTSTGAKPMSKDTAEKWYREKYPNATEEQIQNLIYTGKL
jgi:polyhydroxyalkanoate synthesis regulator phasin